MENRYIVEALGEITKALQKINKRMIELEIKADIDYGDISQEIESIEERMKKITGCDED